MKTQTVKGFRDYLGEDALRKKAITNLVENLILKYGFESAETPIIEYEEFIRGDKQQEGDEAISDIFKLKDKGERELALRYEFTFQLKRISINKKLPFKRYSFGPVFRDEPASLNRLRQFTQFDIDIGGASIKDEAEILCAASKILETLGIENVIYINNRKLINEILNDLGIKEKDKSDVIRIIDKLDKKSPEEVGKELEKYSLKDILKEFRKPREYYEKYISYREIEELFKYLSYYGVKNVEFSPTLARGLSYYNRTVFEVKTKKMKETITAGGSYMFNKTQFTGISFGIDRLMQLADYSKIELDKIDILVLSMDKDKEAISISEKLRSKGKKIILLTDKAISKALDYANSQKIQKVIFVGERGIELKDMESGEQKQLSEKDLLKI
jgi:histidyl-tRNA synthetase